MIAAMVMPMEVPNCETVLNTAPARAWVLVGNTSVIIRFATVKMTSLVLSLAYY